MYSSGFSPPPPMIVYPLSLRSAAIAAFCARVAAFPRRPPPAGAGTPCGALGAAGTPAGAFGAAGAPPGTGNLGKPPPRNGNSTPSRGPAPTPGGAGFFPTAKTKAVDSQRVGREPLRSYLVPTRTSRDWVACRCADVLRD